MQSKIFIINLDRSSDRLASMSAQFEALSMPFERFVAIDGQILSDDFISEYYSSILNKEKYFVPLLENEIACYLSHINVFKQIVEENLDYAVVLEDDVILKKNFKNLKNIIEAIKEPWDMIKLSLQGNPKRIIKKTKVEVSRDESYDLLHWKKVPTGMVSYAITREAAQQFINSSLKFFRPIDVDFQHPWEHKIKNIVGLSPSLVYLDDSKDSTIDHLRIKRHYPLARTIYNVKYALRNFFYKV